MIKLLRWVARRIQPQDLPMDAIGTIAPAVQTPEAARIKLLMRFESLGENCELGFLQEHFGANPLGLFRWSGITLDLLITALDDNLEGIGEAEYTTLNKNHENHEYFVTDSRYGMPTHTHTFDHQDTAENVLKTFLIRARRLREKLLEDLAEGDKIFVFQMGKRPPDGDVERLLAAVRRLGPSAELLFVRPAEGGEQAGAAQRIAPGLIVGLIDRPGYDGKVWDISYETWLTLLSGVTDICDRVGAQQSPARRPVSRRP